MKLQINKIYNYDCIEIMKLMNNQNIIVDLILTDPPYNISKKNNFTSIKRRGIDFGKWDKKFDQVKWLKYVNPILKLGGSILIFNDWKNLGDIAKELEKNDFEIKDIIRWLKPAPMPRNTTRRYVTDYEYIIWGVKKSKSYKWTFNKPNNIPYLRPEIWASPPSGKNRVHPTQKSKLLIKQLLNVHSNVNDLIFDPFSGSGEISLVAKLLNRKYIASELDKTFFLQSKKRLVNDNKKYLKPAINHLGNKYRILDILLPFFGEKNIENFVDVFSGSGVVSVNYNFAKNYFINDNDSLVSRILKHFITEETDKIIFSLEKIIKKYNLPSHKKIQYVDEYNKLKNDFNLKNKKNNSMLLVLVFFGFNQQIRVNSKGDFNIPAGKQYWNYYYKNKIIEFINEIKSNNKKIIVSNDDFYKFTSDKLQEIDLKKTIFYFDPPYLLSNATYNKVWNEDKEKELIKLLQEIDLLGGKFVLSNLVQSKGKKNNYLIKFLNNNKNLKIKEITKPNYYNSNYQRLNRNLKDIEIIVKNYE